MTNSELLKAFYSSMKESVETADRLFTTLGLLRQAGLEMDYEKTQRLNEAVGELNVKLEEQAQSRYSISQKLGCSGARYSQQLIERLSGETQKQVADMAGRLESVLGDCKVRIEDQVELMQRQQDSVKELIEEVALDIKA
ncbi:hypothetical protein [Vibrio breoganii]|nr:hypothetical protein [Vibrio breoganii]